jgi:biuret amidohydrolase
MTERYVAADPYPWPYNGDLRPQNTALIVIDMQTDFCGKGGYIDLLGLLDEQPRDQVAKLLNISAGYVRVLLHRAREHVRNCPYDSE